MIFDPYKYYVQLFVIREASNIGYATTSIVSTPSRTSTVPTTTMKSSTTSKKKQNGGGKRKNKSMNENGNNRYNGLVDNTNGLNENMTDEENENEEEKEDERQTEQRPVLPVDEFEDKIIKSVYENRVTIIQGETGCGKLLFISVVAPTFCIYYFKN